jgi:hypothetical protein
MRHFGRAPAFWLELPARARELGLDEPLALACHFVERWLDTPIPAPARQRIVTNGPPAWRRAWLHPLLASALTPSGPDEGPATARTWRPRRCWCATTTAACRCACSCRTCGTRRASARPPPSPIRWAPASAEHRPWTTATAHGIADSLGCGMRPAGETCTIAESDCPARNGQWDHLPMDAHQPMRERPHGTASASRAPLKPGIVVPLERCLQSVTGLDSSRGVGKAPSHGLPGPAVFAGCDRSPIGKRGISKHPPARRPDDSCFQPLSTSSDPVEDPLRHRFRRAVDGVGICRSQRRRRKR